ncbi:MAG TPA: helix-turn-helix domain-containing protein [Actinomycetota bacterium]|nr:helix-turn-helix domain-containing protein [Actinomycetota bacterium]
MGLFDRTVRARREELGLGQGALAERVGVTQQTISRWESGEIVPPPKRLSRLAEALDLDVNKMLSYAGYLGAEPTGDEWNGLTVFYERMPELSNEELLMVVERAAEELRSRLPGPEDAERAGRLVAGNAG